MRPEPHRHHWLILLACCLGAFAADEVPAPRPADPVADDVMITVFPPTEECHVGEAMEAVVEIQNISDKRLLFGWRVPKIRGVSFSVDEPVRLIEEISILEPVEDGGLRGGTVLPPKATVRGRVFIDRFLIFSRPTSKPIEVQWRFEVSTKGGDSKEGTFLLPVLPRRPQAEVLADAADLVEEINLSDGAGDPHAGRAEKLHRLLRIDDPAAIEIVARLSDQQTRLRAIEGFERYPSHPMVQEHFRRLVTSHDPATVQSGLMLCARGRLLIEQKLLSACLGSSDNNTQTAAVEYVGAMTNALCLPQVAALINDKHVPLARAASRIVMGITPGLPLVDPGQDPFDNPSVPLPGDKKAPDQGKPPAAAAGKGLPGGGDGF